MWPALETIGIDQIKSGSFAYIGIIATNSIKATGSFGASIQVSFSLQTAALSAERSFNGP
ncbi:MAG: hypothetical protein AAGG57_20980 [Pseudomonadota bacterium]